MASGPPPAPTTSSPPFPDALLPTLLAVSLAAVNLLRPVYGPGGTEIVDFTLDYLNPAAQRMSGLPERPGTTALARFPEMAATGVFAFYCRMYQSGEPGTFEVNYQADGVDNYFRLAAQRCEDLLFVSFTDTADQPRTAVEEALRQSQAREQQARAEAEAGHRRLHDILTQLPAQVAVNRGPAHVYELVNPRYQQLFPARAILGRPVREALPELEGQGYYELLDQVYQTGEPFYGHEMPAEVDYTDSGRMEQRYFNVFFQALRDTQGRVDGLLNFAYDVTSQVLARREAEQLNQELEARVFERTQDLRHAQAESVVAAQRLLRVTESLPSTTFTVDQTGQLLYVSPQWHAYTGLPLDAPTNEVWPTLVHPDDLPVIAHEFVAALAEGRAWRYEFRLRGAAGQYHWFASQGQPEPLAEAEAAGRPRQWYGAHLDIDDLKQAQLAQQQQEQLLTSILSSLPAGVVTFTGEELRCSFFNDSFQQLMRGRAVLGPTADELFPEAVAQGYPDLLRGVLRTAEPFRVHEAPTYAQDPRTGERQELFLDLAYLPLRHGQAPPHAVLAYNLDVTERVRTRQRAEAAQAQLLVAAEQAAAERATFHEVFEQTAALVALLRAPNHRYEYVNPAYQALFAGRQLMGRDVAVAVPEMQEQGFVAVLDQVYQTGETQHAADAPFALAPAPGQPARTAYYNVSYQAYREAKHIAGVSIFAYDVTEQVLARRERDAQRQRLHALFMEAPAAICILDGPDLVYELVNPGYQAMFPGRPLLGLPLLDALPELAGTNVDNALRVVYESGTTHEQEGMLIPFTNAATGQLEDRYFNFIQQARRDAQGRPDGVLAFAFEVTEQVRARQQAQVLAAELSAANQQLTRTNVDLDNFIYTASHDLRVPIVNIEGLLQALDREFPPAARVGDVPELLRLMQDSVDRFQRTIAHLTDVSKLQHAHDQPTTQVPLAAVVEAVRLDLLPFVAQTQARLDVDVPADAHLPFSEKNLRSVVYNLLSNALKYRHPDRAPHVQLTYQRQDLYHMLRVQDNGLGFDVATSESKLFGMFQRLHAHVEGTGIGLYMVKKMVENSGGRIDVASWPGEGTTFTVFFPVHPAS